MALLGIEVGKRAAGSKNTRRAVGGIIIGAMGAGLGLINGCAPRVETDVSISGGKGTLVNVFKMPPKECHGGYTSRIDGAKAELNVRLTIYGRHLSTTIRASETYNGKITNQVCNTGVAGTELIDKRNHHVTVNIPKKSLSTMVYQSDPADPNAFTPDNGFGWAYAKNIVNIIDTLPGGIAVHGTDRIDNQLRGWALLAAYANASEKCGEAAWPYLRPIETRAVQDEVVADYNTLSKLNPVPGPKLKRSDVTVHLPETIDLQNQYGDELQSIQKKLVDNNVHVTGVDVSKLVCTPATALKVGVQQ